MQRISSLLLVLCLVLASHVRAGMDIAQPVSVKWNGFAQAWEDTGENAKSEYTQSGSLLKRLRVKMTAEVYDGLSVVVQPEFAGGFFLLDGYIKADLDKYILDFGQPISVTMGQFKTPFGLNRMYAPFQLTFVNYSGISNAVFGNTNFWDDGIMASYTVPGLLKIDAASVEGLGPNQATPAAYGLQGSQDAVGRVELTLFKVLALGGSVYYGQGFTGNGGAVAFPIGTTGPKLLTGAHAQVKLPGKSFQADLEMINRGVDRGGFAGILSQYVTDWMQLALGYDRVEVYGSDKSATTRYQAGINFYPGGPLRLSLNQEASATGPDQSLRGGSASKTILQGQVAF